MDPGLIQFGLTAFVTLLVVVDPIGVAPLFVAITREATDSQRRATLARAVLIAFLVALFFLLGGRALLAQLGVSVHAFAISGGILLFATALPMLFGHRPVMQGPEQSDVDRSGEDPAVFPLAIPLLSGPGAIATILLLTNETAKQPWRIVVLTVTTAAVYLIAWLILRVADALLQKLGKGRINVITRVLGLILAALAVQYVLDGIGGYYQALRTSY
ncbi:MAG TPA: MarC family protein [Burkholderiales bacterium]|nr:MarC family protein [Burkholderiales bacterium]